MSREPLVIRSPYRAPWTHRRKFWSGVGAGVGVNAAWTLLLVALGLLPSADGYVAHRSAAGLAVTLLIGTILACVPRTRRFGIGVFVGVCISPIALLPLDLIVLLNYMS